LTEENEFSQTLLDWMAAFMRISMQDMMGYIHQKGISMGQITSLLHLYYKGPCEVLDFSRTLQLSGAGASQLIERMAQQGWVERIEQPDDRRVRLVFLTDTGRELARGSISARNEWVNRFAASLDTAERAQISDALKIMTAKLVE
jgi:DNA-binding MarR family transcriptional regulator